MLVIEIALSALSILWIVKGAVDYGVWTGQAPGGGLFPTNTSNKQGFCTNGMSLDSQLRAIMKK